MSPRAQSNAVRSQAVHGSVLTVGSPCEISAAVMHPGTTRLTSQAEMMLTRRRLLVLCRPSNAETANVAHTCMEVSVINTQVDEAPWGTYIWTAC